MAVLFFVDQLLLLVIQQDQLLQLVVLNLFVQSDRDVSSCSLIEMSVRVV